jgi:hypothetical protein
MKPVAVYAPAYGLDRGTVMQVAENAGAVALLEQLGPTALAELEAIT